MKTTTCKLPPCSVRMMSSGLPQCINLLSNVRVVYFKIEHKHWMDNSNARVPLEGFT